MTSAKLFNQIKAFINKPLKITINLISNVLLIFQIYSQRINFMVYSSDIVQKLATLDMKEQMSNSKTPVLAFYSQHFSF